MFSGGKSQSLSLRRLMLLALVVTCSSLLPAQRTPAANRSLQELVTKAERIVHGHVVRVQLEPHPQFTNLKTVLVSMSIEETLKGDDRKSLQFRQFVWDIREQIRGGPYRKGEELLLMLNPASQYGLTSPSGWSRDGSAFCAIAKVRQ